MPDNKVIITQDELDRMLTVVSNVHKDNDENEKEATPADLPLSQADVDSLYRKGIAAEKKAAGQDEIIRLPKPNPDRDDAAQIRARKIAERKAHSAQILAQVKASSPRHILVAYGGCVKNNSELENLHAGESIRLDRLLSDSVALNYVL